MAVALLILALAAAPADPVAGRWEGSSLCQIHPSARHDEHVVYHVAATGAGRYRVRMDKLVDGIEGEMGSLDARFDPASATLSGATRDRAGRPASGVSRSRTARWKGG